MTLNGVSWVGYVACMKGERNIYREEQKPEVKHPLETSRRG
jgi:hypothetical protein